VRAATRFQSDQTRRQLGKVAEHFPPRQVLAEHDLAVPIHAMDLKAALRDSEPDAFDLHGVIPLLGV